MLPPPSPPRGHVTHLLEQTLHKVAIWAGLRKRQISDKPGSVADRQAGRQVGWAGSSEAGATLTCQLAGARRPSRCAPSARPLSHLPGNLLAPAAVAPRGALSPVLLYELHQGRCGGHSEGRSSRER